MRPLVWDEKRASAELKRRLKNAKTYRKSFENSWSQNERSLVSVTGDSLQSNMTYTIESSAEIGLGDADSGNHTIGVNYVFKNYRFIHAQLSANPPTVLARPTSADPSDRAKASAADRLVRHAIRTEKLQEKQDITSSKTLLYGNGWLKTWFDPNQGDFADFDPNTGEFDLEGKVAIYSPSTWDVWIDPDATCWDEVRYIFERKIIPLDEAMQISPDKVDALKQASIKYNEDRGDLVTDKSELDEQLVEIYEYWEKGAPINGMVGRYACHLEDGTLLNGPKLNPFAFSPAGKPNMPSVAGLPYHLFTDIDIPGSVYGKSFIEYAAPIQDIINRLDNTTLDNVIAHGAIHIVLPEACEMSEDSISNTPYNVYKIKGTQPPHHVSTPQQFPEVNGLRDRLKLGEDDMCGVNDAMFGQIQRETSGFSLQYATNQGNMIRRRLFNKYTAFVESVFRAYLNLVRKHWKEPRVILVLGKERAFESVDFKGADIDGGFDIICEYGASLSLDPMTRREEIMQLQPLFQQAGVDNRTILSMLKLDELEGLYDINTLSAQRQKEIFDEIIAKNQYIEPRQLQEHKGMLVYAYQYIMTKEYDLLPEEIKILIEQHIRARESIMAGAVPTGPMTPGPKPPAEGGLVTTETGAATESAIPPGILPPQ